MTPTSVPLPAVRLWSPYRLSSYRQRSVGDGRSAAVADLLSDAEAALQTTAESVTRKSALPPSGDPHDYQSTGPYWWPNPDTASGLPYVRRDGEVNPDRHGDDSARLKRMERAVGTLCLAAYVSGEERFAAHAARHLRTWFLDPETRMNPHLEYGQAIPGVCAGRDIGIIDTHLLPEMLDAVALLDEFPNAWGDDDRRGLDAWFAAFLGWLLTSEKGRGEAAQHNNHGTWYDVQVAYYAFHTGRESAAREILSAAAERRVRAHVADDGAQPHELARTRSFHYSAMNLHGLMDLAALAAPVGIDLWNVGDGDCPLPQRALDFLLARRTAWPYPQIAPFDAESLLLPHLLRASRAWPDAGYGAAADALCAAGRDRACLLYGAPPSTA